MISSLIGPFIILQIATVIAIVMFLRMLLHKQLEIGLRRIKVMDKENLGKEMLLNERTQKLNDEYEKRMKEAERQADTLMSMAKEDSKNMREEERAKAKEEAKKIISGALEERDRVARQTQTEMSKQAIDFSAAILRHMFSEKEFKNMRSAGVKDAVDTFMENKEIEELFKKGEAVEIITADDLTAKDKEYILASIDKHGGKKENVKFTAEESILGGAIVKIGESVIDGGFETRIIKAAKELKSDV
ncbi:MAG: F0F1 ATP synthase subunit delta [Candidatus Omnitrophota bacterium]